ncbi:MAG: hypothetical protein KAS66_10745 [Candidatus Omnitrophica bacterium]|nr:hypothetical protein [Candidatus Omnitrophota bacterium]
MQRLKENGGIDEYYSSQLSHQNESTIECDSSDWHGYSSDWHGYGVRFVFDKDGNMTGVSAGA